MKIRILLFFWTIFCLFATPVWGQGKALDKEVFEAVDSLIQAAQGGQAPRPEQIQPLIRFATSRPASDQGPVPRFDRLPGARYSFEVNTDLRRILSVIYNPEIPACLGSPSSIRCSKWLELKGPDWQDRPSLASALDRHPRMLIVRGLEQETSTPDLTTRTYYTYRHRRLLYLSAPQGQTRTFISIATQTDTSDVGHKGEILGPDRFWTYAYTKETGLNKTGLSWVKPYIYDALSLVIYTQPANCRRTRVTALKWLDAGWLGMNMVKPRHIQSGLKRFAQGMSRVLESPRLPAKERLADLDRWLRDQDRGLLGRWLSLLAENRPKKVFKDDLEQLESAAAPKRTSDTGKDCLVCALSLEFVKWQLELPSAAKDQVCRQIFSPILKEKGITNATIRRQEDCCNDPGQTGKRG